MIIKSLSRATKSFEALYKYLTRDKESILNTYNLYSRADNQKELVKEFLENAKYLKNAKGKNYLYHEIISLNSNTLTLQEQINILSDIVTKYILLRASNHLVFTALHTDKEHTHMHLMISSNELAGERRVRLSKKDFNSIQKELEQYVNTTYPQLGNTKHYNKDLKEFKSKKEQLKERLLELFTKSKTKDEFIHLSKELGLEFYTRGKTVGVIFENIKHRLKTIGVLENYEKLAQKLEQEAKESKERQKKQDEVKATNKEKVVSNENENKIKSRREQMRELREAKYAKAREKK